MKTILIIILSIVFTGIYAQDYKELIQDVPGLDKYPNALAINVFTKIDIEVNKDGSSVKHVYYIKKILTYKGKRKYSDVKITYNTNIESVEFGDCFSIHKGKRIDIPKEATHDNETYLTMYSPEYINQRQKIINFPAIEPNDFIIVDYTVVRKPHDYFSGIEQMQEDNPYLKKILSITTNDKDIKLYYKTANGIQTTSTNSNGKTTTLWTVENMPALKDERSRPSLSIIGKPIFYSTIKSWAEASDIYFKQFNSVNYNTKEVADLATKITNSKLNDEQKLQNIYAYLQDNFEFKYALDEDGYAPHKADKVLNQKFGNTNEITALFIAMAKSLNIKVKPVLVNYKINIPELKQVPCSEALTTIQAFYKGKLISFQTQYMPFGTSWFEKAYLIFNDNKGKLVDYTTNLEPLIIRNINIKLNTDYTANVDFAETLKGREDFLLRRQFKNQTEKKRKIWFTNSISDKSILVVGEPVFKNIQDYNHNLKISFTAKINNFYNTQDNYIYFKLPESESIEVRLSGKNRENEYEIPHNISFTEKYIFENIPEGYSIIKPKIPIIKTFKSGNVEMFLMINSEMKDGKLIITKKVLIPKTIISKDNYQKFADFIGEIEKPLNDMVFLSK